jgi:FKBP-type peptidyl-prolyl cis-trans isomerase SlyD
MTGLSASAWRRKGVCHHRPMPITAPCVVSLTWKLADAQGNAIDELTEPVEFFFGGDDLLPKVEEALEGEDIGFEAHLHLEPEHAFGDYDAALVCFEARSLFPQELVEGMQFEGLPEGAATQDMPADRLYTVTEVYPTHVVLDGNHPLAGMALRIDVTVRDVREATEEEIEAGSVGAGFVSVLDGLPPGDQLH